MTEWILVREMMRRRALEQLREQDPDVVLEALQVADAVDYWDDLRPLTRGSFLPVCVLINLPAIDPDTDSAYMRETDIPEPWLSRLLAAERYATIYPFRNSNGPYYHAWSWFLRTWFGDMQHMEACRAKLLDVTSDIHMRKQARHAALGRREALLRSVPPELWSGANHRLQAIAFDANPPL